MQVVAVIPARGSSKGLFRKNVRSLCGKPLITYSIEVARKAELIDRVVVSTEDEEIGEVAKMAGAEVPFLRPEALASDHAGPGEGVSYTLQRLLGMDVNHTIAVVLYPTSPFRTPAMLDLLINIVLHQGYSSACTVKYLTQFQNGTIYQRIGDKKFRQLPNEQRMYRSYGSASVSRMVKRANRVFYYPLSELESIDIDYLEDFLVAEEIIRNGKYDFGENKVVKLDTCPDWRGL